LRARTRRRLIGAALLLLGTVLVLPMLLDSPPKRVGDDVAITVGAAPPPKRADDRPAPAPEPKVTEPAAPVAEPAQPVAEPAAATPPPVPLASPEPKPPAEATAPPPRPVPAPAQKDGKVAVQVAALSTLAAAEELQVLLIKDGFTAYVMPVTTVSGVVHRVRVGPYPNRDEAQRAVERLKSAGHKATLVGG
jgi:DedD protein